MTHRGLGACLSPYPQLGQAAGLGGRGGATVSISPRMCERGYGNDSTGEGLGFKNNHLGGRMASWPHQLSWIPVLPQLGCVGIPVWAVPTWEWSWGEDSMAVWQWELDPAGMDACMPPCSAPLKPAVPQVEADTGWMFQWGT